MNNISLVGRITVDPELKYTQSNFPVISFTVAVDRPTQEKQTDFIPCVAWRKTAEFVSKYFSKGSKIALVGSLQSRKWQDKDGKSRTSIEVLVDRVEFCESKKSDWTQKADAAEYVEEYEEYSENDQLPF